ncbi:hypothetical protein IWZ01DRAFT_556882 [Phyllosticta capitalensis]
MPRTQPKRGEQKSETRNKKDDSEPNSLLQGTPGPRQPFKAHRNPGRSIRGPRHPEPGTRSAGMQSRKRLVPDVKSPSHLAHPPRRIQIFPSSTTSTTTRLSLPHSSSNSSSPSSSSRSVNHTSTPLPTGNRLKRPCTSSQRSVSKLTASGTPSARSGSAGRMKNASQICAPPGSAARSSCRRTALRNAPRVMSRGSSRKERVDSEVREVVGVAPCVVRERWSSACRPL